MATVLFTIFGALVVSCLSQPLNPQREYQFPFVSRNEWVAREPTSVTKVEGPVPFVVIHHTYRPEVCELIETCKNAMRSMQDYHQLDRGWADIGYNFAIGGEGRVYEGRGWDVVGAHAIGYNSQSVGIVFIGDWVSKLPSKIQLEAGKRLIEAGVRLGYIRDDYKLIGHRQASATECPGQALFQEISKWDHFTDVKSLLHP